MNGLTSERYNWKTRQRRAFYRHTIPRSNLLRIATHVLIAPSPLIAHSSKLIAHNSPTSRAFKKTLDFHLEICTLVHTYIRIHNQPYRPRQEQTIPSQPNLFFVSLCAFSWSSNRPPSVPHSQHPTPQHAFSCLSSLSWSPPVTQTHNHKIDFCSTPLTKGPNLQPDAHP